MNRKKFIFLSMKSCAAAAVCGCIAGCSEENPFTPETLAVDFTLDLSDPSNSYLANDGGSLYRNGVIIGKINNQNYAAVSQTCTHQGTTIQFELSNNRFHCPNHDSNFTLNGEVINGPATRNLQRLNTYLNGNMLRIFS